VGLAARHPRRSARLTLLAGRNLKTVMTVVAVSRQASRVAQPVRRAARDPEVHAEAMRAAKEVSAAAQRAQKVGVANSLNDKRVARSLRRAQRHATRATNRARREPPRRRRRVTVILVGAGVVGGLGYTGWRTLSRDSRAGEMPIESGETDAADMPPVT
jgi:hypothetical protein